MRERAQNRGGVNMKDEEGEEKSVGRARPKEEKKRSGSGIRIE